MPETELVALLLAEVGPVADPLDLAERIIGDAYRVPRMAIGAPASLAERHGRPVLLIASDVPMLDVHRACAFLASLAWLRRHGVDDDEAELAAEHVALGLRNSERAPISGVLSRLCAG